MGLLQRYRDKKVLKELKKLEQLGEIIPCGFCERYRLEGTDCDCIREGN